MNNSPIENKFIDWCQFLHPDINAYIFIQRYGRYAEEYLPLLDENMTQLHQKISSQKPNINFSFKGRIKSKRSFLIKTFRTLAENIEKIFPDNNFENQTDKLSDIDYKNATIEKCFKFLINENPKRFEEIKQIINNTPHSFDTIDSFRFLFNKLSPDEKDKLVARLGRTEDAFAYRPVIHSVDFSIKSVRQNSSGNFEIIDSDNNVIPIQTSIKFSLDDIIYNPNGTKNIKVKDKEMKLNDRNLLYPHNLSSKQRNFDNAFKDSDGKMTLLQDSLVINDKEFFDISSINTDPITGDILISNQYSESKNLSLLLNSSNLKIRKTDETYTVPAIYDIFEIIKEHYKENDIIQIQSRSKDYIKNPKHDTNYRSIHNSSFNELFGYTMEAQIRDLDMEDDCKNESTTSGHDKYKKDKLKTLTKNPILSAIIKQDSLAFDSSTQTLLKLLDSPDIELSEILGKYILITKMANGMSISYQPTIDNIFEHTFEHSDLTLIDDENDPYPPLDISSYKNFIKSRKIRNEARNKEKKFPDFYE